MKAKEHKRRHQKSGKPARKRKVAESLKQMRPKQRTYGYVSPYYRNW